MGHASIDTKEGSEMQSSKVVGKEFHGFNHSEKEMLEDLEKEQKQPLLAAKTTSQKTQRKKWCLFSRKPPETQEIKEEAPTASSPHTSVDIDREYFQAPEQVDLSEAKNQLSPVRISNGVFVTRDGEDSLHLTAVLVTKDTSCNANSRNSQEKLAISEPSSSQDVHQISERPEHSLELSSVEQRKVKLTDELSKTEEAGLGLDSIEDLQLLKLVSSESRQSEHPAKEAAEGVTTQKKKMFVDSAFYADPEGKYPTMEEQISLAYQLAHSILLPINQDSRGHRMFMKMGQRARAYTTGASAEEIATALAELNLSSDETEKFYQETPWTRKISGNQSMEGKSLEVVPPRLHVPSSVLFAPNLTANMSAEQMNALSSEELERVMSLQEISDSTKPYKPQPQTCFRFSDDIRNMKGKGARLFAERQAKAESWTVDDHSAREIASIPAADVSSNRISLALREGAKMDSASVSQQISVNEPSSPTRSKVPPKTLPKMLRLRAKGEQHDDKKCLHSPSSGVEKDNIQLGTGDTLPSESEGGSECISVSFSMGPACNKTSTPSSGAEPLSDSTLVCHKDQPSDISSVSQSSSSGPTSDKEFACLSSVAEPHHDSTLTSTSSTMGPAVDGKTMLPFPSAKYPVCDSVVLVSQSLAPETATEAEATALLEQSGSSAQESCKGTNEDNSLVNSGC